MIRNAVRTLGARAGAAALKTGGAAAAQVPSTARPALGAAVQVAGLAKGLRGLSQSAAPDGGACLGS